MKKPYEEHLAWLYLSQACDLDIVLWVDETACRIPWPCTADKTVDAYHLATFVNHRDGTVSVECSQQNGCNFKLDLTAIRRNTQLYDEMSHIVEGQTLEDYMYEVDVHSKWLRVKDIDGLDNLEATYRGWGGFYDAVHVHAEVNE